MKRLIFILLLWVHLQLHAQQVWTAARANEWYEKQPWLVGSNYIPYNAINQLEMWQAETFDAPRIEKELKWAKSIGMNTMRVFLHDLLWKSDAEGFKKRLNEFLAICDRQGIKPMLVLFDSVWDPYPQLGKQREPKPGVHNSGWIQGPGSFALRDENEYARLEEYVRGVVSAYANDNRILCWDVWNEPDNINTGSYNETVEKLQYVERLLPKVFTWAHEAGATQPITSGVWKIDYKEFKELKPIEKIQLEESDVISFHQYEDSTSFHRAVKFLLQYQKPLFCTEYLVRGNKITFETILPLGKKYKIAMYNWGLVAGKT